MSEYKKGYKQEHIELLTEIRDELKLMNEMRVRENQLAINFIKEILKRAEQI